MAESGDPSISPAHAREFRRRLFAPKTFQFSLGTWLCFIMLLSLSAGLFASWYRGRAAAIQREESRRQTDAMISKISGALQQYQMQWGAPPPDNVPDADSARVLWFHLCNSRAGKGPFLSLPPESLSEERNGMRAILLPDGTGLSYSRLPTSGGGFLTVVDSK